VRGQQSGRRSQCSSRYSRSGYAPDFHARSSRDHSQSAEPAEATGPWVRPRIRSPSMGEAGGYAVVGFGVGETGGMFEQYRPGGAAAAHQEIFAICDQAQAFPSCMRQPAGAPHKSPHAAGPRSCAPISISRAAFCLATSPDPHRDAHEAWKSHHPELRQGPVIQNGKNHRPLASLQGRC